jgi:hypothetical protein
MQSSPSVDTSRGWIGQTPSVSAGQRAGKAEARSPETPARAVAEKEEAFPDVLKQVVNPVKEERVQTDKAQVDGTVSSDFRKTRILSDPDSTSESSSETAGMLPAWLTSLLGGLAVPVSAPQEPVCAGLAASVGAQSGTLAAVGTGQGRAPLDALLQRLQNALKEPDSVDPDGAGLPEDDLAVLQKSLMENVPAGAALLTQFEGTDEGAGEEVSLPTLVTIRHAAGVRMAGDEGDNPTGAVEEVFSFDPDSGVRELSRKLASAREGEGTFPDGTGADLQNPVAGQVMDQRHAVLPTDRFSLDASVSLRHVDLTNAVRQAQAAIADMTERMQGEVSLNTETLRAVLRLDPPALGRLNIRLEIDDSQRVTAYLHADQAQTGDFLRQNEGDLRQGFTRQGFDSDKVQFVYEEGETGNFDQWLTEKALSA